MRVETCVGSWPTPRRCAQSRNDGAQRMVAASRRSAQPDIGQRPIAPDDFDEQAVRAVVADFSGLEGPLLPILHAITDRFGHVAEAAVPVIADALNLSRAEVHGVVSFYHDFRRTPAGRHVIKVCRAEACQAMGAQALWQHACTRLAIDYSHFADARQMDAWAELFAEDAELVVMGAVQRGRASCAQTARCACACTGPCTVRATLRRDCSAQGRNLDVHLTSKRLRWGRIFPTMNWSGTSGTDDQGMDVYWTSLWTSIGRPYVDVHEALKTGISAVSRPADKAAREPSLKSCAGSSNATRTW